MKTCYFNYAVSTVILGLTILSKQRLIAEVNFYHFGTHRIYFTANAIVVSFDAFQVSLGTWSQDSMLSENQSVTVCFLKTVISWAKKTKSTRMRHLLEETNLPNWIRSSRIYMAAHLQTTLLTHRKSATCWPQIRLQHISRLISARMQNCWTVQGYSIYFMSQLHTIWS